MFLLQGYSFLSSRLSRPGSLSIVLPKALSEYKYPGPRSGLIIAYCISIKVVNHYH